MRLIPTVFRAQRGIAGIRYNNWQDFSRSLSATGGPPPGVEPVPIPWDEYKQFAKQFGLLVGKQVVNYLINKGIPVEIQILDPRFFSPSPADAADIPSSPVGATDCYSSPAE